MRKLFIALGVCVCAVNTAVAVLVIWQTKQETTAAGPFTVLGPWPLELWSRDVTVLAGYRLMLGIRSGAVEGFALEPGKPPRKLDMDVLEIDSFKGLNGEIAKVYIDRATKRILGVKDCSSYSVSPCGTKVAVVYPAGIAVFEHGKGASLVTPSTVGGLPVTSYKIPHSPEPFVNPVWSPDGRFLVYRSRLSTGGIKDGYTAWVTEISTGETKVLIEGETQSDVNQVCGWMHDQLIVAGTVNGIKLVDPLTGKVSLLAETEIYGIISVSPTGDMLAGYDSNGNIVTVDEKGVVRELTGLEQGWYHSYGLEWSPDGKRLAFLATSSGTTETVLFIAERETDGSLKAVLKYPDPGSEYRLFVASGQPVSWVGNDQLLVFTQAKRNTSGVRAWLLNVRENVGGAK